MPSPPKTVVARSLAGLHTERRIRLGDRPTAIVAVYGPAPMHAVHGRPGNQIRSYERVEKNATPNSSYEASMTFLSTRDRLTAMDSADEC